MRLLGGAAAGAGLASKAAAKEAARGIGMDAGIAAIRGDVGSAVAFQGPSPQEQRKWRLFQEREHEEHQRRQAEEYVARMCGYLPPHLASMHSNAMWFRAQRATEWNKKRMQQHTTLIRFLRKTILGED